MITIERFGNVHIVPLGTRYSSLEAGDLEGVRDDLLDLAESCQPPRIVFDLSETEYVGSAFLEILFRVYSRMRRRGGQCAFCAVQGFCRDVFHTTRLDSIYLMFDDRNTAVAAMSA